MKKLTLIVTSLVLVFVFSSFAFAVPITVTYTADNVIGAWWQNGSAPVAQTIGTNASNWQIADSLMLDLATGTDYQVVFCVQQDGAFSSNNPAAFLGQIAGDVVGGTVYSSTSWEISSGGSMDNFDDSSWGWVNATEYGTNGGSNIWSTVNGGPVAGIGTSAQWIWENSQSGEDNAIRYVRGTFSTAAVPEPSTLLFLGFGLLGLAGLWRKE